ncbi:MAG: hypothetical protein ACLP1Y_09085 [Candidatus Acidiferrales bacterium]
MKPKLSRRALSLFGYGLQARVARVLHVSAGHVRHVAWGERASRRVSSAIAKEIPRQARREMPAVREEIRRWRQAAAA